jgi:ABC-type sugar transport system ATPase subunit
MSSQPPVVEVMGVAKRYGGAQALDGVTLDVSRGEVHGLVGENGAGKSTLGKIMAGVVRADAGEMRVGGDEVSFRGPRDALQRGIAIVEQELALVPAMSAAENVLLGYDPRRGPNGSRCDRPAIARINDELGLEVELDAPVERLSLVAQQKVEILRALVRGARLVVMDEPTARLPGDDARALLALMRRVSRGGTAIVFVSHFLEEVLAVADRISVLRDGRLVKATDAEGQSPDDLVTAMLGREATLGFPAKMAPDAAAPVVLSVRGLSGVSGVRDVSLSVARGEIVALAGLVGSGRTEVARLIFGADARTGGEVEIEGRPLAPRSPREAIAQGVAYVPESRKDLGLFLSRSSAENITLPYLRTVSRAGLLSSGAEARAASPILQQLAVRPASPRRQVRTLSGGNQQKVLFAKWLWKRPCLLIADEPTRGVDVGAKFAIYELLAELAASGMAILLISSEMEEVLGLAHRVVVMRRGRQIASLEGDAVCEDAILRASFASEPEPAAEAIA